MSLWKDHPVMTSSRSSLSGDKSNHTTRFKMSAPLPNSQQPCSIDHEAMANMKTEFMALWDKFSTDPNARVMVLAATNRPSELDEAIMRRLPQAFEIGMPERKERAEILKVTLKGERVEPYIDCEGYTGSDIFELCKKATPLSQLDLEKVLATAKKTQVAAGEYCGLRWSREPDEVEAAISGFSKLLVSQFINLHQSGSQDKTIHLDSNEFCTSLRLPLRIYEAGTEPVDNPKVIIQSVSLSIM
ncbi:BnaC03g35530D [Brassica napus]|uniref:BnaC03g35530D protein n=3 Tax=Brassica TaxID=3705 RepID=A0A078F0J9_BRANA|nr:BnaC03g35530D [Brassica napus]